MSEREKLGLQQVLGFGPLEATTQPAQLIGHVIGNAIARLLDEGAELDTINVVASPEKSYETIEADVLVIRVSGERDRPEAPEAMTYGEAMTHDDPDA